MHMMEEGMMSGFCVRTSAGGKCCVRSSKGSMSTTNNNGSSSGTKCGRWNPTAEQVKVLTELFRSGLRTPTTDQIQKISSQLSFYGKIESKNVFYWFQNHKARERQKRRKVSFHDDTTNNNSLIITTTSNKENCFNLSAQRLGEMYQQVSKPDTVIETLQLFPLNSFGESESANNTHKLRVHANDHHQYHCRVDDAMFSSYTMAEQLEHPPLDLRLSFM